MELTAFDVKMDTFISLRLNVCTNYCRYGDSMPPEFCLHCPADLLDSLYMSALRADALLDK